MFCPNCGSICEDSHRFCIHCGAALSVPISGKAEAVTVSESVPQKKGRLWPPVLIMGILVCLGLGLFFVTTGINSQSREYAWFSIQDGELYFDEARYTGSPELTVPETVDGQRVTALSPGCFANCKKLTIVYLPDSLVTVGSNAFAGCTAMRGIRLPERVTTIGAGAFSTCISLEAVCIPTTVNAIGAGAFECCDSLRYIMYPGSIRDWQGLYSEYINGQAKVYCAQGVYPHQFDLP